MIRDYLIKVFLIENPFTNTEIFLYILFFKKLYAIRLKKYIKTIHFIYVAFFSCMSHKIIKKYSISAKKSLGQNFLIDEWKVQEIADTLDLDGENIVEVGPGYWALTEKLLAKKPQALHLIELDRDMIGVLESRIWEWELSLEEVDFQIYNQDVLEYIPSFHEYSVIANIPYYITSPILRYFLYSLEQPPENMLILMQQDVGDRILQKHKNKSSVLSLMVQKKCRVSEKILVPKESFIPIPKVESSVLLFETHDDYNEIDDEKFLKLIKIWFSQSRKKLVKNLVSHGYSKEKIEKDIFSAWGNIDMRSEDGDIVFWAKLTRLRHLQ